MKLSVKDAFGNRFLVHATWVDWLIYKLFFRDPQRIVVDLEENRSED